MSELQLRAILAAIIYAGADDHEGAVERADEILMETAKKMVAVARRAEGAIAEAMRKATGASQ